MSDVAEKEAPERRPLEPPALGGLDVESAVLRLVEYAAELPASDMFLAPGEVDGTVSARHLGVVRNLMTLPKDEGRELPETQGGARRADQRAHRFRSTVSRKQ